MREFPFALLFRVAVAKLSAEDAVDSRRGAKKMIARLRRAERANFLLRVLRESTAPSALNLFEWRRQP
jgi:hypothetical protein